MTGSWIYLLAALLLALAGIVAATLVSRRKKLPPPGKPREGKQIEAPGKKPQPGPESGREKAEKPEKGEKTQQKPQEKPEKKPEAAQKAEKQPEKPQEKPARSDLVLGLAKTRGGFIARLGALLSRKQIDTDLLNELEEVLLSADIGVQTAQYLFEQVRSTLSAKELKDPAAVWGVVKAESRKLLNVDAPPLEWTKQKPFVTLIIGVNGAGKTTTIGKLAAQQIEAGRKVVLAAGDTFRAAAVEQLAIWGQRSGAEVVKGKEGGDPSAVIFDAVKRAQQSNADVVIADTAGRLHVKAQLMEELQKIRRVIKKADPTAPHETFLVLDATNGQNAIAQAKTFKEAMEITGIILTKLDGTAKGGVILGIAHELGVPVRYIGIGEKIHDLRAFDAREFVDVLYEQTET